MKDRQAGKLLDGLLESLAPAFKDLAREDFLDDFDSDVEAPSDEFAEPALSIRQWIQELRKLQDFHSHRIRKRARKLRFDFELYEMLPSGEVSAWCEAGDESYDVELIVDPYGGYNHGGGCDCDASGGTDPCVHTYCFIRYLLRHLEDPDSPLRAQFAKLANGEVAEEQEQSDEADEILEQLDLLVAQQVPPDVELDEEVPVHRILWHIEFEDDGVTLSALKQRPKKRGGGWTKGQRIALDTLRHSPELITSAADARAVEAIRETHPMYRYYRSELSWDMIAAVDALVGHDNVMVDDEPADVKRFTFGIHVADFGETVLVQPAVPLEGNEEFLLAYFSNGLLIRSNERPLVLVCPCNRQQSELAQRLQQSPRFPRRRLPELLQRLDALRPSISIELSESLAGPFHPEQTTHVALLRSHSQGYLECGLRVKDGAGNLHLPGEGSMVRTAEEEGHPVQYRRDGNQEVIFARRVERELRLDQAHPLSPWNWRLLDVDQSLRLLEDLETVSRELGFSVVWDPRCPQPIRIVGSVTPRNVHVEVSRKRDWFGLDGTCRIGDKEFKLAELLQGIQSEPAEGYMEVRPGEWARITEELRNQLQQLRDVAHRRRSELEISEIAAPVIQELVDSQLDIESPREWKACLERLERARELDPVPPKTFRGTLRDYQVEGYKWLRRLAEWGVGGCLADDMGLGKTIQALAVLIDRQTTGPALVIAPTSVGFNWIRETERFAPDLRPHLYRETDRAEFLERVGPGDVVICSYGLALRDEAALRKVKWGTLILDEAQFIKNSRSKTSQAIRTFKADWRLALTGTPMENHLGELWSVFRNLSPGLFGSWDEFRTRFAGPIEREHDDERRAALSQLIRPFVLRRTKSEVLSELPERTEMNLYVELSDEERRRYDEMRLAAIGELDQIAGLPETNDQRFRILALLTRLRQLACHVALVDSGWQGNSAKIDALVETLNELREEGHRALIFSQFTSFLALVRKALDEAGITYQYLDGSTPAKAREERIDAFQSGQSDAFLISLKAGGTGLNLTAADYVIHLDPWWNPAVEDQATDRAHRIGQTRPVMVYRLVTRGTIEEQILDLHAEKRDLVAGVMEGTQSSARLSTEELIKLIRDAQ